MGISPTAFAAGLYLEHLEEISFLYEQRISLLDDPQIRWTDIEEFENRLEAHLDALIVGGRAAMDLCLLRAQNGDSGECYGALRLFCRQDQTDTVKAIIAGVSADDPDRVRAAADALKVDMPERWAVEMAEFILEDPASRIPVVARAFGFRRLFQQDGLAGLFSAGAEAIDADWVWAMGRVGTRAMRSSIEALLGHPDWTISSDAALAMLRIGEPDTLSLCLSLDRDLAWSPIPMGIGGGPQHISRLVKLPQTPDSLIALGLLGHVGVVDLLLNTLAESELKPFAAMALQMIFGADLTESAFLPDDDDEDERWLEVSESRKDGRTLQSTGRVPGQTVTRLSEDPHQWANWWSTNHVRFRKDRRYRNGLEYAPSVLVEILASENSPRLVRQMAYEELVVRYNADFAFETDMLVADQRKAIAAYRQWLAEQKNRYHDGKWYFSGRILI